MQIDVSSLLAAIRRGFQAKRYCEQGPNCELFCVSCEGGHLAKLFVVEGQSLSLFPIPNGRGVVRRKERGEGRKECVREKEFERGRSCVVM